MLNYYEPLVKQFTNGAEQRPFYVALQARRNACLPPKQPWSKPHLVEAQRQLFSRVVVTVVDKPIIEHHAKPNLVKIIQQMVCRHYRIGKRELLGTSHTHEIVLPRHVAMYLVRRYTVHSLPQIGRRFGGRDHSSIHHAYNKISFHRRWNLKLDAELKEFERRLGMT